MRMRYIKPELLSHPLYWQLSERAQLLLQQLPMYADDETYFNANLSLIRNALRPLDPGVNITRDCLAELARIGVLEVRQTDIGPVGMIVPNCLDGALHQVVNRPQKSKLRKHFQEAKTILRNWPTEQVTEPFRERLTDPPPPDSVRDLGIEGSGDQGVTALSTSSTGGFGARTPKPLSTHSGASDPPEPPDTPRGGPPAAAGPAVTEPRPDGGGSPSESGSGNGSESGSESRSRNDSRNGPGMKGGDHSLGQKARVVFDYWRKVMGKDDRVKWEGERQRKVLARLREGYSVEELCLAVDGCKASPHNMGENDRHTVYADLELICRSAVKVDYFMEIARTRAGAARAHPGRPLKLVAGAPEKAWDELPPGTVTEGGPRG